MSIKMRYRSSVAIAVPVCCVNKREDIRDVEEDVVVREVDGPGR